MRMTAEQAVALARSIFESHETGIMGRMPSDVSADRVRQVLVSADGLYIGQFLTHEASVCLYNLGDVFVAMGEALREQHWGIEGKTVDPDDPDFGRSK